MKKLHLAYCLGIVFFISIVSFTFIEHDSENVNVDKTYCIQIECKKDPSCNNSCVWYKFKEEIVAPGGSAARQIAVNKHPGCRVGVAKEGRCN